MKQDIEKLEIPNNLMTSIDYVLIVFRFLRLG